MFVILFLFQILVTIFVDAENIVVQIPNGEIRGRKEYSLRKTKTTFYAFQQIPFGKPPIGDLRFADPEPAEKWDGILDATHNTKICYQQSNMYNVPNLEELENEDCLYLNVYTPREPYPYSSLPVMFFFFGGGFVNGAGNFDFFGPHYLMEHDIIVVTINYRVGPFGFLTTGDTTIAGNYGLKDQLLALKWVKDNILYFGGDPSKVTIFGQSAGAASVTFHLMSKQSEGLFRAAIAQSGSILCPWAYQREHRNMAYKLASGLDPSFKNTSSSQELLNLLRSKSAAEINTVASSFKQAVGNEQIVQGFWFTPVIEPEHQNAFITEYQYDAISKGHMNKIPLMIGICSEESIARAAANNFLSIVRQYEHDVTTLVNRNMHLSDPVLKKQAGEAIRDIYTEGLLQDNPGAAVRYFSDTSFTRGIIRHAQLQSQFSDVYFYQFSYHGTIGGNRPNIPGAYRVGHAEDNHYLWVSSNHSYLDRYPELDIKTSDRYRTLFTNFAKYLNPTPEPSELLDNITWPTVKPDDFQYLDINETITLQRNPKNDVYPKWVNLYEEMAVKPYDTF
ncbi:juvenile hormone esterase-like isoform X1 [Diabrotica virgifera virgifera]|uniref:Carboxylic ester hydrolase n=1 Tax=Diabrotica virgifera virgifera TaxID=50390 RepID=A0ABM5JP86_DIAVI|nr:juvenile hormone esterase-like isoform X1 [Diabrotica virgifera virgifera]